MSDDVPCILTQQPKTESETKPEKTTKQTLVLSPTSLTDFQMCPRFFNWRKIQGYGPMVTPSYFSRGSVGHSMLAEFYRMRKDGIVYSEAAQAALEKGRKEYINEFNLPVEEGELLVKVVTEYFLEHSGDRWVPIAIEAPFSKALLDTDKLCILLEGVIDLVVEHSQIPVIPVDHKFKARTSPVATMSNQFQGYTWALGVNVFIENEIGVQKSTPKAGRFHRRIVNYETEVLADWAKWAVYWASEIEAAIAGEFFPPKFSSCHTFSTGCTFIDVCTTRPEMRDWKLSRVCKKRETTKSVYDYREKK